MSTTTQPQRLLLISPDGRRAANVGRADVTQSLYAGWTDCTALDDESLRLLVAGRQLVHLRQAA